MELSSQRMGGRNLFVHVKAIYRFSFSERRQRTEMNKKKNTANWRVGGGAFLLLDQSRMRAKSTSKSWVWHTVPAVLYARRLGCHRGEKSLTSCRLNLNTLWNLFHPIFPTDDFDELCSIFPQLSAQIPNQNRQRTSTQPDVTLTFSMLYFSKACVAQSTASCCISSLMSAFLITAFLSLILGLLFSLGLRWNFCVVFTK